MTDQKDLIQRLAILLDACTDHLDRLAEQEKRREEGKSLRSITHQKRAASARDALDEAWNLLERR